jgi:hypothetical protein
MMFSLIEAAIVVLIVAILVVVGWGAYNERQQPPVELKKDDWVCAKSEQRTTWQTRVVGEVTITQPITSTVCVEYVKNNRRPSL